MGVGREAMSHRLTLVLLPDAYAVVRLPPAAPTPAWSRSAPAFFSITRTPDELSIVCPQSAVPAGLTATHPGARLLHGLRLLKVHGPLDFSLVGVIASLAAPLAAARISLFPIATFDTDYLLIRDPDLPAAIQALTRAGHAVTR